VSVGTPSNETWVFSIGASTPGESDLTSPVPFTATFFLVLAFGADVAFLPDRELERVTREVDMTTVNCYRQLCTDNCEVDVVRGDCDCEYPGSASKCYGRSD
jgi:hypothetical protein